MILVDKDTMGLFQFDEIELDACQSANRGLNKEGF